MNTNYSSVSVSSTTATVDTSQWHKIRVDDWYGVMAILGWLQENRDELSGGYTIDGNAIRFQNKKDATFFNLTFNHNADD